MAWRIHQNVLRGEVDNRRRGVVTGRIWLKGMTQPILLDLKGNAAPDLAGCLLSFENPGPAISVGQGGTLNLVQAGTAGDLTASRKVRVFDMPVEEAYLRLKKKLPVPEHLANCLYLEWFSESNGRVVIESTDYKLSISSPAWRLTPTEDEQRQHDAAAGFNGFVERLNRALDAQKHEPPEDKEWDEFDYEKFMRESDARTEKYGELLDKYLDEPDRDRLIAREMGWTWLEESLEAQAEQQAAQGEQGAEPGRSDVEEDADDEESAIEELKPEPATEGVDWVRDERGHIHHPLCLRTLEGSVALYHQYKELGLANTEDDDLCALLGEYQTTGAKLAGALNTLAYGRGLRDGAFVVACLKRALSHLHSAQAALEKVASKNSLPVPTLSHLRAEFFAIREESLRLMQQFRGK